MSEKVRADADIGNLNSLRRTDDRTSIAVITSTLAYSGSKMSARSQSNLQGAIAFQEQEMTATRGFILLAHVYGSNILTPSRSRTCQSISNRSRIEGATFKILTSPSRTLLSTFLSKSTASLLCPPDAT